MCLPRRLEQIPPAREHERGPSTADRFAYGLRFNVSNVINSARFREPDATNRHAAPGLDSWIVEEGITFWQFLPNRSVWCGGMPAIAEFAQLLPLPCLYVVSPTGRYKRNLFPVGL